MFRQSNKYITFSDKAINIYHIFRQSNKYVYFTFSDIEKI